MSIISLTFIVFILAVFILYYLIPKQFQWILLLIASILFYISAGLQSIGYVLLTTATIYLATVCMQKLTADRDAYLAANKKTLTVQEKKACKESAKKKKKRVMLAALILNVGLLCFFKYFHFAVSQLNGLLRLAGAGQIRDTFSFIVPLGISFYTFQSVGYLLNVYWEKSTAEQNFFRLLLFVSFFPQISQGPISDFDQLSSQLFSRHSFSYKNYAWGFQRLIWGYFKKMVIANQLAKYTTLLFAEYAQYTGISVFLGAVIYSIQLYADFSGYMDIMCGFCQVLDIELTENFNRPFFSKSISEFWRRWHISLGAWLKNYIYFPIGMAGWTRKISKSARARFGKYFAANLQATIALLIVWLVTGMWHAASWGYILWGLLNGSIIIFSTWMEPVYKKCKSLLHIQDTGRPWHIFQILRTFILMVFVEVLPDAGTLSQGLGIWTQIFTNHRIPHSIGELLPYISCSWIMDQLNLLIIVAGIVAMFVFSLLERRQQVRVCFNRIPAPLRWLILACMLMLIGSFGVRSSWGAGGFMYAQY